VRTNASFCHGMGQQRDLLFRKKKAIVVPLPEDVPLL
jgi:hypothetical protein